MSIIRTFRNIHTSCIGWTGFVVSSVQAVAGKAATTCQDMGVRRVEAGGRVDTAAPGQPAYVDALFWPVNCLTVSE